MEKIQMLVVAVLVALGINAVSYLPLGQAKEESQEKISTEYFFVQSETQDGYLHAEPVAVGVEGAMVLDNKYEIGNIVEVSSDKYGDIVAERLITGEELEKVEYEFAGSIDYLMDMGIEKEVELAEGSDSYYEGKVQAEDGSWVNESFYEGMIMAEDGSMVNESFYK